MPRWTVLVVVALLASACGTRVDPQVFARLTEGGGGATAAAPGSVGQTSAAGSSGGGTATANPPAVGGPTSAPTAGNAGDGGGATTSGGSGGSAGGTTGGGQAGGSAGNAPSGGSGGGQSANGASDTGVSANQILVGNITTKGGPLGPNQFTPMVQGAKAYFAKLNARGGVNGRQIKLVTCDDKADPDRDQQCAHDLIENQKIFAFVANSTRAYSAAKYVSDKGVPDVGGQPVGNEYFTYPTLYAIRGAEYPRNGTVGYKGKLYNGTGIFRYFTKTLGINKAAVFYYNIPQSKAYGLYQAKGLREEGYQVTEYEVNPALPSFDSYVADMRSKGVQAIFDSMDLTGNQNLCRSMQRNDFSVKAKVSVVSSWSRRVQDQFADICKKSMYVWGESIPYTSDTAQVKKFRSAMHDVYQGQLDGVLHQWHLEGWLAAKLFTDAVKRLGANVTRKGVMDWLNSFGPDHGYGGDGLIVPQSWSPLNYDQVKTVHECISVAKWNMDKHDFFTVPQGYPVCYDDPLIAWQPAS